jgi:hypothetical protein
MSNEIVEVLVFWKPETPKEVLLREGITPVEYAPDKFKYMRNGKNVDIDFFMQVVENPDCADLVKDIEASKSNLNCAFKRVRGELYCAVKPRTMYKWYVLFEGKELTVLPNYRSIAHTFLNKTRRARTDENAQPTKKMKQDDEDLASNPADILNAVNGLLKLTEKTVAELRVKVEKALNIIVSSDDMDENNHN